MYVYTYASENFDLMNAASSKAAYAHSKHLCV